MTIAQLWQDFRFASRMLRRQQWITIAAVLTIGLGVGANTAIVSALDAILLNPLGLRDSGRVVWVTVRIDKLDMRRSTVSGAEFRDLQSMKDVFAFVAASEGRAWTSEANGEAMRIVGRAVTPDYFQVFALRPQQGRFFEPEDRESVVLTDAMWRTQFAANPNVVGQTLMLDGKPHRIVGVAPPAFRLPANTQAWTPLIMNAERMNRRGYNMALDLFARLKDGVSREQAAGHVNRYVDSLKAQREQSDLKKSAYFIDIDPFSYFVAGDLRRPLLLVWGAALVVMLTACANVAGLLLTRSAARLKEIAIRLSIGATRVQILRQLLVEGLLLATLGGIAGLVMAPWALSLLKAAPVPGRSALGALTVDARLLAFGLALALVSGLVFGLAPGVQMLRRNQAGAMARSRRRRGQDIFVAAEVAAAFVLLAATGLFMRSLWAVESIQPGFDPHNLATAFVIKPKQAQLFSDQLVAKLSSTPGVASAALAYPMPFTGGGLTSGFRVRDRQQSPGEPEFHGEAYMVSPSYFETLRIPLIRGRLLADTDTDKSAMVCLIDAKTADRFFRNQDPIGQEIAMYKGWARIVGVVGAIRGTTLETGSRPIFYYAAAQIPFFQQTAVIVRSVSPSGDLVRRAVRDVQPSVPVFDIQTMQDRIDNSVGIRRVLVMLLGGFGLMAMLLAAIGIHALIAQFIAERTQEIGIRMALGARPGTILTSFLRHGAILGVIGAVAGLLGVVAGKRVLQNFLYETNALDPATLAGSSAFILLLLSTACLLPALRAARIDPQTALRQE